MNTRQINQYDMYLRVHKTLNTYHSVWAENPRFTDNYQAFSANLQAIKGLNGKLNTNSTSVYQQKAAVKEQLVEITTRLIKKLRSFAADTQDRTLSSSLEYTKSSLEKIRESQLPSVCLVVHEKAQAYLEQLGHYGVTHAELEQMRTLTEHFEAMLPEPKLAISNSKQATEALADLFRKNNLLLNEQLDGKLEQFQDSHADFYAAYFDARNIIERSRKPEVEAENGTEA